MHGGISLEWLETEVNASYVFCAMILLTYDLAGQFDMRTFVKVIELKYVNVQGK
jgi:hypothetical protein